MWAEADILAIAHDQSALALLRSALESAGYHVRSASCGASALAAIAAQLPQLILLDVTTPGMDGGEICRQLKASDQGRDIPLILITAADAVDQRVEGLRAGAIDFVVKPFQHEDLMTRARTHLELKRQRMNSDPRQEEELHRLAMMAGRMFAFEWNPATDEVRCSEHYAELLGVHGEARSQTWSRCIQRILPEDRSILTQRIIELRPENDTCECEYRVLVPEGGVEYHRSVVRALFDDGSQVTRYIGMVSDITRARQAEAAFAESEKRFQHLADSAPMMICASGPDKAATYFNKAWLAFTGRSLGDELGSGWTAGVHPDDLERCLAGYSASFDARRECHLEYRLRRADGEYRWILCNGNPQFAADGTFTGYIATCIDTTDLKRVQEEAFDQQRVDSLRVLTGGIAHDFNNLLGSILVETDLAEAEMADGISPLAAIRRVRAVATRAAEIVRELMIYSGQDKATLETVNLSLLVKEMLELLKVSISKNAQLRIDLAKKPPVVLGNTSQLRQVVMNLILNASDALGNAEGWVQISTSKRTVFEETPPIGAIGLPAGDYVELKISDSGCGMTEDVRTRIFEPFFTTKSGGHGLGLALMQGIVRSHGGTISVASTPGKGTTFEVLLPSVVDVAGKTAPASHSSPEHAAPVSGTVLLVESEESLRVSVGRALHRRGVSVLSAADGHTAIEVFRAHEKDIMVVVLDLALPGMAAAEVLQKIELIRPHASVILTSVVSPDSTGAVAPNSSIAGFLRKPYRISELMGVLQTAIPVQRRQRPSARAGL
jgi:PAS domain S-box-containing protein